MTAKKSFLLYLFSVLTFLLIGCDDSSEQSQSNSLVNTDSNVAGYQFNQLFLTSPPFEGTIWITGDIITPSDPSLFSNLSYQGIESRVMYDRRNGGEWVTQDAFIFPANFTDELSTEIQVNPEFDFGQAQTEAFKYAKLIGQLPTALREGVETMWIHRGEFAYGGGNKNIMVHTGMTEVYQNWDTGIVEETLLHEAVHSSLDEDFYPANAPLRAGWDIAVAQDTAYISTYARDNPVREDLSELLPLYVAVRYFPERIDENTRDKILSSSINRILFLDAQDFNFDLYNNN
ncbi:MAG: hypothetical protein ACI845_002644 [Gammaproteobacteria bacterium]|jgi:hypothetical protein